MAKCSLRVILVDVSGLAGEDLVNLAHSWHLEDIPLQGKSLDISTPVTLLLNDGSLQSHWDGLALPANLALTLQKRLQR